MRMRGDQRAESAEKCRLTVRWLMMSMVLVAALL